MIDCVEVIYLLRLFLIDFIGMNYLLFHEITGYWTFSIFSDLPSINFVILLITIPKDLLVPSTYHTWEDNAVCKDL